MACSLRRFTHSRVSTEHDEVCERDPLAPRLRALEGRLNAPEHIEHRRELLGLVGRPVLLRSKLYARTVGPAALVAVAIGRRRRPCGAHELAHAEPIDNYTLRGVGWDRIHVSRGNQILLRSRDFQTISPVDLYTKTLGEPIFQKEHGDLDYGVPAKDPVQAFWAWLLTFGGSDLTFSSDRILWSKAEASARGLYYGDPQIPLMENEVWAALHARQEHVEHYASTMRATPSGDEDPWWNPVVTDYIQTGMKTRSAVRTVQMGPCRSRWKNQPASIVNAT